MNCDPAPGASLGAPAYTVATLAAHWGVSDTFVYDQISAGRLRAFKLGNKLIRIRPEAVTEYEQAGSITGHLEPCHDELPPNVAVVARLTRRGATRPTR